MNMKRVLTSMAVAAGMLVAAGAVSAQQDNNDQKNNDRIQKEQQQKETRTDVDVGARGVHVKIGADKKMIDHVFRTEDLVGMTVRNAAGKELGAIEDLVLNADTGHVRYAAISFGGFLGIGDKLFAVPLSVTELAYDAKGEEPYLVFDVTEEKLKQSPGFNKDRWPNVADPKWSAEIDKFYGVTIDRIKVGARVSGKAERDADDVAKKTRKMANIVRTGEVIGLEVRNASGEELGKVEDLIVNARTASVTHYVIATGGILGLGESLTAAPQTAVSLRYDRDDEERVIILPISKERMKETPRIQDDGPNLNNPQWSREFDTFFAPRQAQRTTPTKPLD